MTTSRPAAAPPERPPAYAYDAFLSYSSHDLDLARALRDRLVKEGVRVWFDKDKLTVGTNINTAIDEALDGSRHLIALLSPASIASDWASMEQHVALFGDADARRRTVLPIVVRHVDKLPPSLRFRQYLEVDGVADLDRVLPEILSTLRATAKSPPVAAPPPPSRSRGALVIVLAVVALALGLVYLAFLPPAASPDGPKAVLQEASQPDAAATSAVAPPTPPPTGVRARLPETRCKSLVVESATGVLGAALWGDPTNNKGTASAHLSVGTAVWATCKYRLPKGQFALCVAQKSDLQAQGWMHHDRFVGRDPGASLARIRSLPDCPTDQCDASGCASP